MCLNPMKAKIIDLGNGKKKVSFKINASDTPDMLIDVPCGHCPECAKSYSHQWSLRNLMEYQTSDYAFFVTLTYDDNNCPVSLSKRDVQLFLKRLRKKIYPARFRYFIAGEYGSNTLRPHYHCIIYNLDFSRFPKSHYVVENGYLYFSSKIIEKCWPFGFNLCSEASPGSIFYTCKYSLKKSTRDKLSKMRMKQANILPEFVLMSKRPGLGSNYINEHYQDIIDNNGIIYINGFQYTVPRTFLRKMRGDLGDVKLFMSTFHDLALKSGIIKRQLVASHNNDIKAADDVLERSIKDIHDRKEVI